MTKKSNIPTIIALYHIGYMNNDEVIKWADDKLMSDEEDFDYIHLLSLHGAGYCIKLQNHEFPDKREFTYLEEFSIRTMMLDLSSNESINKYLKWVTYDSSGLDIEMPEVYFGYLLDHYFYECEDKGFANKYLCEGIEEFKPKCKEVFDSIMSEIS